MKTNARLVMLWMATCVCSGCQNEVRLADQYMSCNRNTAAEQIVGEPFGFCCDVSDVFAAFSYDCDADSVLHVTIMNKTRDMLLILHKMCGVYYDARYEDENGGVRVYQTGTVGMADWETSMLVLNGQGPDGADASCFWSFPMRLPFKFKKILNLQLNLRYAKPSDIASVVSISDVSERCKSECVPVDIRRCNAPL